MRTIIVMLLLSVVSGCGKDVQDDYIFKSENGSSGWVEEITGDCPKQYNVYPCLNTDEILLFIRHAGRVSLQGKTLGEVRKKIKELAANDQKN